MPSRKLYKNLKLVVVLSRDVYREALKERMMYGFLLLALLFIFLANVPFMIDDPKVFEGLPPEESSIQIGFVAINIFTMLIAVFASLNTLQSFLCRERLVLLLSKPVRRWQILEGVILGLFEMIFLNWFLMTVGIWLVFISQTRTLGFHIWTGMSVTLLMALVYVTLAVFFYVLIPNTIAGILAMLVIIAGFGASLAQQAFSLGNYPVVVRKLFQIGLNVLPKINELWGISLKGLSLFDLEVRGFPILLHTVIVVIILNLLSSWKFRRFCQF